MAGIKDFKRVAGANAEVAELQKRLLEFFTQFVGCPLLDGVLLDGIELENGASKLVEHKLNRPHQGWLIISKDANCDIWETESSKSFIKLNASVVAPATKVTVALWVF